MSSPRDSQCSKVYAAERMVWPVNWCDHRGKWSMIELQQFVDKVCTHAIVRRLYPELGQAVILIRAARAHSSARGGHRGITMPRWSRSDWVTCHELAHVIVRRRHKWTVPAHGAEFCSVYLDLVEHMIGWSARMALTTAFIAKRVNYRPQAQLIEELKCAARPRK